jgi:hypothetical protein
MPVTPDLPKRCDRAFAQGTSLKPRGRPVWSVLSPDRAGQDAIFIAGPAKQPAWMPLHHCFEQTREVYPHS